MAPNGSHHVSLLPNHYPKEPGQPQTMSVRDVGSTFGTTMLVGGGGMGIKCGSAKEPQSEPRMLADGDVVRIGQQRSAFRVRWVPLVQPWY